MIYFVDNWHTKVDFRRTWQNRTFTRSVSALFSFKLSKQKWVKNCPQTRIILEQSEKKSPNLNDSENMKSQTLEHLSYDQGCHH